MKEALKSGFLPGIIATLCCLGPLFFIMLGLVSTSTALSFTVYSRYFIPLGLLVLALMLLLSIKKREIICSGCTDKKQERKRIITFVVSSVIVAVVTYLVVFYIVLPVLAPFVFDNFYRR